jgi:RNA polymerase II-associated factor 1
MRYASPEFLDALAHDMPFPMIVDAECGMPLDLGKWESLWLEEETDPRWRQLDAGQCFSRHG